MGDLDPALLVAAAMLGALVLYALSAGAGFGGGVWDLAASGRDRNAQRALIGRAIGPSWEASHGALVLVGALLYAAFPSAFTRITTLLHVPILLLLASIVLRGAAFVFGLRRSGVLFSIASIAAPLLLGAILATLASGKTSGYAGVTGAWPLTVGAFTLALFAYLFAVYLCAEAREKTEEGDSLVPAFRARALAAWLTLGLFAIFLFFEARADAPEVARGLTQHVWSFPLLGLTLVASLVALHGLVASLFRLARVAAAVQVALVVIGWGASQYPWLVAGEISIADAAAEPRVLWTVLGVLAAGSVLLVPSLYFLSRSLKGRRRGGGGT